MRVAGTIKSQNRAGNSRDASLEIETHIAACRQTQVFCKMQLVATADEIRLLFANLQVREGLHLIGRALSARARSMVFTNTHTHRTHTVAKMQVIKARTQEASAVKRLSLGVWVNARAVYMSLLLIECGC